jgi:hypothetical protein
MRFLKRRHSRGQGGATVVDPPDAPAEEFAGSTDDLYAEIDRLTEANRANPDRAVERRLLRLRHVAGLRLLDAADGSPEFPAPDVQGLPEADELPEIAGADVTPELVRAGILRDGCLLVRGLVERDAALAFAQRIDRLFEELERIDAGGSAADGYYEEFRPDARYSPFVARDWIKGGGGILAADSPVLSFELIELFVAAGVPRIVDGYLGEPGMVSMHKTTLRKASPSVPGAWHQDGTFMGDIRSLNLWLSLSRCGDVAPGLDIVPRRLDHLVTTQTDEAMLPIQASQAKVEEAAGDTPIIRPIFEPGDALFFDEMFMHQTASDPAMPNPRFAVESWFFGASAFPADYAPVAAWR